MISFDRPSPLMRSLLPIITIVVVACCSGSAEEPKESININALLQNDELLDALILGGESPKETILGSESKSVTPPQQEFDSSTINLYGYRDVP